MRFRAQAPQGHRLAVRSTQGRHRGTMGEQGREQAGFARHPVIVEPPRRCRSRFRRRAREIKDEIVGAAAAELLARGARLVGRERHRLGRRGQARPGQAVDGGLQPEQEFRVRRQPAWSTHATRIRWSGRCPSWSRRRICQPRSARRSSRTVTVRLRGSVREGEGSARAGTRPPAADGRSMPPVARSISRSASCPACRLSYRRSRQPDPVCARR